MQARIERVRKFSSQRPLFTSFHSFASISGILLVVFTYAIGPERAFAQPAKPRAETDSRPSEPAPPPSASPTAAKPTATPGVKPTPKPAVAAKPSQKPTPAPSSVHTSRKFPKIVTKLMIDDLQNGRGRTSKPGARLVVHFQSWLYDPTQPLGRGPQFESTIGKAPYKFTLQSSESPHIKGWEEGLIDMKTGGKRRLIIPPELAYGANGAGQVIPPGATLLYEIELIDVE